MRESSAKPPAHGPGTCGVQPERLLIDTLPVLLAQLDLDERFVVVNKAYASWHGLNPHDVIGRTAAEVMGQELYELFKGHVRAALRGEPQEYERVAPATDGSMRTLQVQYIPHRLNSEGHRGLTVMIRDVTEQRRARAELDRECCTMRLMLDKAVDFIFRIRLPEGVYEYVSPASEEVVGYPPSVLYENPLFVRERIHPDFHQYFEIEFAKLLRSETPGDYEYRFIHPGKGVRWALQRNTLIRDGEGRPVALEGVVIDVTSMKQKEEELAKARETAESANMAKSEFLARVSHETRTPLHGLLGQASLALEQAKDPVMRRRLTSIRDSASQMHALLSDILDFASLETGRAKPDVAAFEPSELAQRLEQMFREQAEDKGLVFSVHVAKGLPGKVKGDRRRLRQILSHLLSNAVKFTSSGEVRLEIGIAADDGSEEPPAKHDPDSEALPVRFAVWDTGSGVGVHALGAIQEEFRQGAGGLADRPRGLGLGLALARRMIELLGGRLEVDSRPGLGSVFSFSLGMAPVADADREEVESGVSKSRLKILMAEDNPMNASLLAEWLLRAGHTPVAAGDGVEALDVLKAEACDVALMDLEMPAMSGLEATRRIRAGECGEAVRNMPIYALTAHVLPEYEAQCKEAGMDGFLAKPLDMDRLYELLARVEPSVGPERAPAPDDKAGEGLPDRKAQILEFGGNEEFVEKLYTMFRRQSEKEISQMELALAEGDIRAAIRAAHSMKNSALGLGAERLVSLAEQFQKTDSDDIAGAVKLLASIEQEVARVLDWID